MNSHRFLFTNRIFTGPSSQLFHKEKTLYRMQYECFLATGDLNDGVHEETFNAVHEAYGEVYEVHSEAQQPDVTYEANNEVLPTYNEMQETNGTQVRRIEEEKAVTTLFQHSAMPDNAIDRRWIRRILDSFRRRAYSILAAAAIGVIVWTALLYGVFLGATVCGNSRTCSASLKYTHAKRSLFQIYIIAYLLVPPFSSFVEI